MKTTRNTAAKTAVLEIFGKSKTALSHAEIKRQAGDLCVRVTIYRILERLVNDDIILNRKIERLDIMQNMFKYWHVAHLPFALVMLIIMIIHVGITIIFGYRWIF